RPRRAAPPVPSCPARSGRATILCCRSWTLRPPNVASPSWPGCVRRSPSPCGRGLGGGVGAQEASARCWHQPLAPPPPTRGGGEPSPAMTETKHPCRNRPAAQGCRRIITGDVMPAPYATHRAQLKAILLGWGMPEDNAETTADVLSWADLHGVDSHGISMIPRYDQLRRGGRVRMDARPTILQQTPVSAVVDGGGGLGHVPSHFAMSVAIDKAKQSGMAIAVVRNSAHFGATGYYTLMAAKAGLIGMGGTSASSVQVAPTFGKQAK